MGATKQNPANACFADQPRTGAPDIGSNVVERGQELGRMRG